MNKPFNPRTKKVTTIGEELRFQREYYCYKNNVSLPLKVDSTDKKRDERESLQNVLLKFMKENVPFDNELSTSYDVLYAIENGKSKKKGEKYNPNTHFLRMFCLFKIYDFLDSLRILELMTDKYNLEPQYETSLYTMLDVLEGNSIEELIKKGQRGKVLSININYGKIFVSKDTYLQTCDEDEKKKVLELYKNWEQEEHYKETYSNGELIKKEKIDNADECFIFGYIFKDEINELQKKMKKLSNIEKYTTSLELGEDTSYIPNFINGTLQNIHIDTLLKTLEYFEMKDSKFYDTLLLITKNLDKETLTELESL